MQRVFGVCSHCKFRTGLCAVIKLLRSEMGAPWPEVLFVLLALPVVIVSSSAISLENNGYKGIVVAIHKDVPYQPQIVDDIKKMVTSASNFLHVATRNRAFFDDVTIVVPSHWGGEYEVVQGGDRFSRAHVQVVSGAKPITSDDHDVQGYTAIEAEAPFTMQPGECGEEGQYIRLTTDFIAVKNISESTFGDPGRVFVHEWSHFRYGVFDEHGLSDDDRTPEFYTDDSGMIHATGCTGDIRGWLLDEAGSPCVLGPDGLPGPDCEFFPDENSTNRASVMYLPALPSVDSFCDDNPHTRHNPVAPNKHNLMCEGKSTWEVIAKHADFENGKNQPRITRDTIPKFRVIQPKKNQRPTFVLVLDTSASMRGKRIDLLRAATSRFIRYQLSDFSTVGMVSFSTNSSILANMTALDEHTRDHLLYRVPAKDDNGFTAIGKGILNALKLLRDSKEPTEGTLLLLVTDGEENVDPYVSNVLEDIKEARVIINTVAFGRHASSKLEKLVKMTGGRGFFYDDEKVSHKFLDSAFIESAATHADIDLQPVEIVSKFMTLGGGVSEEGSFVLDKDVGRNLEFLLSYDFPSEDAVDFIVWSPGGHKKYTSSSPEYKSDRFTLSVTIKIPVAQPGKWKYWVKNKEDVLQDVSIVVSSEARDIKEQPIRVRSWVSDVDFTYPDRVKVYAEVRKGERAVVDASVTATIARPVGDPHIMMLFDNGIGADTQGFDGVYSGYFSNFNGTGRYSVEAVIVDNGRARVLLEPIPNSRSPRHLRLPKHAINENLTSSSSAFMPSDFMTPTAAPAADDGSDHDGHFAYVDKFERFSAAGAFKLEGWVDEDLVAPSRVTDLKVEEAIMDGWTVSLSWTSPGDDLDFGQVDVVEVRYHHDPEVLFTFFNSTPAITEGDILQGTLSPPQPSQPHMLRVRVNPPWLQEASSTPEPATTEPFHVYKRLYFAVRATDAAGNIAPVSNVATATFGVSRVAVAINHSFGIDLEMIMWGAVVALVVLIVIVVLGLIACRLRTKRRSQKYKCRDEHGADGKLLNRDPRLVRSSNC